MRLHLWFPLLISPRRSGRRVRARVITYRCGSPHSDCRTKQIRSPVCQPPTQRFAEDGILRGEEIVRRYAESHATLAGYLEAGAWPDVEVVPLLFTQTNPIGTITSDAFERIVGEMLELLRERGRGTVCFWRCTAPPCPRSFRMPTARSRRACGRSSGRTFPSGSAPTCTPTFRARWSTTSRDRRLSHQSASRSASTGARMRRDHRAHDPRRDPPGPGAARCRRSSSTSSNNSPARSRCGASLPMWRRSRATGHVVRERCGGLSVRRRRGNGNEFSGHPRWRCRGADESAGWLRGAPGAAAPNSSATRLRPKTLCAPRRWRRKRSGRAHGRRRQHRRRQSGRLDGAPRRGAATRCARATCKRCSIRRRSPDASRLASDRASHCAVGAKTDDAARTSGRGHWHAYASSRMVASRNQRPPTADSGSSTAARPSCSTRPTSTRWC